MSTGPLIVAHRGESHDAPENTLAAFELAWARDDQAIELDVRLTADGTLIVCHDADTFRTTGVHRLIARSSLQELQMLDAGAWKGPNWAGEIMPTLQAALTTVPPRGVCLIEVKVGPEAVLQLARVLGDCSLTPEQTVVISFNSAALAEVRDRIPRVPTHLLTAFRPRDGTEERQPTWDGLIAEARHIGACALNVHFGSPITPEAADRVRQAGLELFAWTVDDVEPALRLASVGVDGMTSNRAAWLRAMLARERAPVDEP